MVKASIVCSTCQSHQYCPSTPKPYSSGNLQQSITVQLGSYGSLLLQVLFAYCDQLQKKNETNCAEWYKFPSHAWGSKQLVSVMVSLPDQWTFAT